MVSYVALVSPSKASPYSDPGTVFVNTIPMFLIPDLLPTNTMIYQLSGTQRDNICKFGRQIRKLFLHPRR